MRATIFTTPILKTIFKYIARVILFLVGWKTVGEVPVKKRFVLIGAPHTSNWDFILMLLIVLDKGVAVHWMGKDSLFPWPFKGFMQWLGGIAVDRSQANNTVEQVATHFSQHQELIIIIPPEGTRSKASRWKTGFYYIAETAQVPIVLGFIDAAKKEVGIGPEFQTTGDIDVDLPEIQAFYKTKRALRPESF